MIAQKEKLQSCLYGAVIASELSHVFCCGIPVLFSLFSLLAGLGLVGSMPYWMEGMHNVLHAWELPLILTSAVVLVLGWVCHLISQKIECDAHAHAECSHEKKGKKHNHNHEICASKQKRTTMILHIATMLFMVNVSIYVVFHRGLNINPSDLVHGQHVETQHDSHDH